MTPTSQGPGPFKPSILWNGRRWTAQVKFELEDQAYEVAREVVEYLDARAVEYLNSLGYEPQRR